MKAKVKQMYEVKNLSDNPAPIKVLSAKHAKRLLSRLIYQLQTKEVTGQDAKDIAYLLSIYIQIFNQMELEERIKKLELQK